MEELERTVEPSWPKLVEPLEKIVDRLSVVWGIVNHLKSVKDSPELRSAIEDVQVLFFVFLLCVFFFLLCSYVFFFCHANSDLNYCTRLTFTEIYP